MITLWLREENMKLTEASLKRLQPTGKQYIQFDDALPSFGVRVGPTGTKSYVLRYRVGGGRTGRQRRMVLAKCEAMRLEDARDMAREMIRTVRQGGDPLGDKVAYRGAPNCDNLFQRFMTEHVEPRRAKKTATDYRSLINRIILPEIGHLKVADVTTDDIEALHRKLGSTPAQANRVRAIASKAFELAEVWRWRKQSTNPCKLVEKYPEEPRDRTFSNDEITRIGAALSNLEDSANPNAILAIRIAALTGLRIGEVLGLRWTDIDFKTGVATLPKTKTGRRILTLPAMVLQLLNATPPIGEVIIHGRSPDQSLDYKAVHSVWRKVCKKADLKNARIHDLRHTVATAAAANGAGAHVVRDLLGHKTLAMANLYVGRITATEDEVRSGVAAEIGAALALKNNAPEEKAERSV